LLRHIAGCRGQGHFDLATST